MARRTAAQQAAKSFSTRSNPVYESPWNKWFPYEPIPSTPKIGPYHTPVIGQVTYRFCTCGESVNQPFCEGTGQGGKCAKVSEFTPFPYKPLHSKKVLFCGCKKAPGPECTGVCVNLWSDLNPLPAAASASQAASSSACSSAGSTIHEQLPGAPRRDDLHRLGILGPIPGP
eukprot:CAMPEP_0170589460 /NCGR_PEP_ID=MMETSP0224-20130122/11361_1 /TAXON_ID=285029 /ORGANISM="Togula jolla, Strain CCCM 725" /LENGTH=170 /DNA_ID=CAMNT_0010913217 /DNA_START=119 /DNA_END=632 /DNA_ORIENTATION=-